MSKKDKRRAEYIQRIEELEQTLKEQCDKLAGVTVLKASERLDREKAGVVRPKSLPTVDVPQAEVTAALHNHLGVTINDGDFTVEPNNTILSGHLTWVERWSRNPRGIKTALEPDNFCTPLKAKLFEIVVDAIKAQTSQEGVDTQFLNEQIAPPMGSSKGPGSTGKHSTLWRGTNYRR